MLVLVKHRSGKTSRPITANVLFSMAPVSVLEGGKLGKRQGQTVMVRRLGQHNSTTAALGGLPVCDGPYLSKVKGTVVTGSNCLKNECWFQ